eukprot:Gb_29513 [translate_table: standard]
MNVFSSSPIPQSGGAIGNRRVMLASHEAVVAVPLHKDFFKSSSLKSWYMLKSKGQMSSVLLRGDTNEAFSSSCCHSHVNVSRAAKYPQNVDLPPVLPKNKKKPFPTPIKEIRRAARQNEKKNKLEEERGEAKIPEPPENGLLVPELIPIAHEVLEARKTLVKDLLKLLSVVPVYGCRYCSDVHVGPVGNQIRTCKGPHNTLRNSSHEWIKGYIDDILVPIESFHLFDRLGKRVSHKKRFEVDRIPAIVELCIQAGVDIPQYPTRRRTKPVRMIGRKIIDPDGYVKEPERAQRAELSEDLDPCGIRPEPNSPPLSSQEIRETAERALKAWDTMRRGAMKLKRKYAVKACGYCSEVHVGPWGHKVKLCGAFKHQWRDGKHGWQEATLDELIPPKYVWHVRDLAGPPLRNELKRFYGQAPAIVEICMQAGATIPERYKPMMRLDIAIPDSQEAQMAA